MLSIIAASVVTTVLADPSGCNHFLGSPIDRCDFETENGRFYGLFCVDADTVEGRTFSDAACTQDMKVGHQRPCVAPHCHCGGSSDEKMCPTTSIESHVCPDSSPDETFSQELWSHVRDVCVSGPNLDTAVKSTCVNGALVYEKYDNSLCEGTPVPLHCVGSDACGECEDYVVIATSEPCTNVPAQPLPVVEIKPETQPQPKVASSSSSSEPATEEHVIIHAIAEKKEAVKEAVVSKVEETIEAKLEKKEEIVAPKEPQIAVDPVQSEDCCDSNFKSEQECQHGKEGATNCVSCAWNASTNKCEFQSRLVVDADSTE